MHVVDIRFNFLGVFEIQRGDLQRAFHHRVIWFVDAMRFVRVEQGFGRPLAVAGHED